MDKLIKRFDKLERAREEAVSWIDSHEDLFREKPDAQTWSLGQVIDHVTKAEAGTLQYVTYKLTEVEKLRAAGFGARVRSTILSAALRSPLRFKAPEVGANPSNELEWSEAKEQWEDLRNRWRSLLKTFPEELAGTAIYRHPVAGRITIEQTLSFMQDHLAHHRRQLERIDARLRSR